VKTTLEIPDDLLRQAMVAAALRGESLKDFVTAALQAHLETQSAEAPGDSGWRSVFGRARLEEVAETGSSPRSSRTSTLMLEVFRTSLVPPRGRSLPPGEGLSSISRPEFFLDLAPGLLVVGVAFEIY
jgi:hypothetical protein